MVKLDSVSRERDIGGIVVSSLKPSLHCVEAAKRASVVLGQITRSFLYRNRITFQRLFVQFVQCHLELAVPAWSPWSVADIDLLERVQQRAVNLFSGLQGLTYEEKVMALDMQTLQARRLEADLILVFKIIKGLVDVEAKTWFNLVGPNIMRRTRHSSEFNIIPKRVKGDVTQHFFANRVVSHWNELPSDIKEARSLSKFKSLLKARNA